MLGDAFSHQSRALLVLEGCMADRGFIVRRYQCNNALGDDAANQGCYYRPYSGLWDMVWRDDLQAEMEADYQLGKKLRKEKASN